MCISATVVLQALGAVLFSAGLSPAGPLDIVREAEQRRVDLVRRITPATVCVFDEQKRGGGSGVLIDADGYGLTNYHVVAGLMETRKGWGGLGDGVLYELQVLGVDVTGDVAMFRLIPPSDRFMFPHVPLGDSDKVQLGDPVLAVGNPFSLSEDYSPTVTMGIVTGVHRYQKGFRGNLVYTDCIQTDASINPGNSGGPLFNFAGEIIGINGRISVNTRGRFNVGFAYAISANQIRRFIPALRAGLLARHGTWEATVSTLDTGEVVFDQMRREGAAYRAGLRIGDVLLAMDGTAIDSANQAASLLGTYPSDWPVLVRFLRDEKSYETIVRLDPIDPHLRAPIEPNRMAAANRLRQLLTGHRERMKGVFADFGATEYLLERTRLDGEQKARETYTLAIPPDGPARLTRRTASGGTGREVEFDASNARQRSNPDADAFELPPMEAMTLSAMYVALVESHKPFDSIDLNRVSHFGADALVPASAASQPRLVAPDGEESDWGPLLLEVIGWTVGEQGTARLGFDAESGRLVSIKVRDQLSGAEVDIHVEGNAESTSDTPGIVFRVQGGGMHYEDRISKLEHAP